MSSLIKKNSRTTLLIGALLALPLLNWAAGGIAPNPFPSTLQTRLTAEHAMQTAGFLTLGMHRLAADIEFIDLLTYYGDWENNVQERINENGGGHYPEIKDRTLRVLDLDPYFTYAALYGSGSLAFNLDRPQEALEVLQKATAFQPKEWKYHAYVIAIGLRSKNDVQGFLNQLTPILEEPDCPTQLKNMLAFINMRLGHRDEAIRIYKEILASHDPNYAHLARQMLERMGVPIDS